MCSESHLAMPWAVRRAPCKGTITQRHDFVLPILGDLVKEIGFEWGTSSQGCGFPSTVAPAVPNQGQCRLQGDKKTQRYCPLTRRQGQFLGINITIWNACADSHRQSEMAAMAPNAPAYVTQPAEPPSIQSTAACVLPVASSARQQLSVPMRGGVRNLKSLVS